jgi:pathogenesis-related protein 1
MIPDLTTTTSAVDFASCLRPSPSVACFQAAPVRTRVTIQSAPGAPSNLVATSAGSSVTLTWAAPQSGDPVQAYIIEAGSASGLANLANFSTGNNATTFLASGVGAGSYYVRVRAMSGSGAMSGPSNEALLIVGTAGCTSPPGAPGGLAIVSTTGGTVVLAWTTAAGNPTSYIVEAGSAPGLANLANNDLGSPTPGLTATGVGPGVYYVRVRARNGCGVSGPSNEITVSVASPTPTPTPTPFTLAAWLDPHNSVRAGTFTGVTLTPAPSPTLPALTWSTAAEAVAQGWANGCVYEHNAGRSGDGIQRGENIAALTGQPNATPATVVGLWAGEWLDYSYASNTCGAGKVCGHYTQLVWRNTTKVGCARTRCAVNSPFGSQFPTWDFFVCDYEPPGNVVGQRPY